MSILIKKKQIFLFIIKILLILLTYTLYETLFHNSNFDTFRNLGKYGAVLILVLLVLDYISTKVIFKPYTIIFICFCLFQFGIPILYGFIQEYKNYYISRFSIDNIIFSAKYTILCIQFFDLGVNLFSLFSKQSKIRRFYNIFKKSDGIRQFSRLGFYLLSIFAVPLVIFIAIQGLKLGYSEIKMNAAGTNIPLFRFIKTMFIPLGLLYITFENNKKRRIRAYLLLFLYSGISLLSGGRTEGLVLLLVLSYSWLNSSNRKKEKLNTGKVVGYIVLIFSIVFMLNMIASLRMGNNYIGEKNNIFVDMIEEMGFNFTSITFTKDFVPEHTNYSYGMSYISSLICLIPKSIDPTGIVSTLNSQLPELWLADTLNSYYGNLFAFGVGYSVIAEAYYNFGEFGYLFMIVIGYLIGKIFSKNYTESSDLGKYIQLVMLFSLATWPRRSMLTLFKALEYNIFLVFILYIIFELFVYRKKYLIYNSKRRNV